MSAHQPITNHRGGSSMTLSSNNVFALDHHPSKADPELIATDEQHFAVMATTLAGSIADLEERLAITRESPGGSGQQAMDRDAEIYRLTARLRLLRRFSLDLCLGRIVSLDSPEPVYVGRVGLQDEQGTRLLVDWRTSAAEPFFSATHADPMGLASRRRYRWTGGQVSDYWDEAFTQDALEQNSAALDDQSAFIASLGASRSPQMRDVLSTIQADQDAIIRASSRGALVVDGGPGTGKTVVALHRAAYLLYADPRLGAGRGSVLFVGPHRPYLAYVSDVLPSLGEEGVQTCTIRDLVPEGATAGFETHPEVARLKASVGMVSAIEPAVQLYEEPPRDGLEIATPWADVWLSADDWAEAFESPDPGTPHNEARDQVWEHLVTIVLDKVDSDQLSREDLRRVLAHDAELTDALQRAWPLLDAADLVGDLWEVPAYLRRCAPWLSADEVRLLQRENPQAWTLSDLPLLDAARRRLGDRQASLRARRHAFEMASAREEMNQVVDHLVATDDSEMLVMSMLRVEDAQSIIVDESGMETAKVDATAGPFAHVVVDEAQELTDAEWQMLLARCPSRSFTIVGDRAQARRGFTESWEERLERVGLRQVHISTLGVNYRTPAEIMAKAEPVIRALIPDANVPTSIRSTGTPVRHATVDERDQILSDWLYRNPEGTACVIGDPTFEATPRVRSLPLHLTKGLEFDLVLLVEQNPSGNEPQDIVDRYVAMTRATGQLVILSN